MQHDAVVEHGFADAVSQTKLSKTATAYAAAISIVNVNFIVLNFYLI